MVSVIVPVYNTPPALLSACLQSLLAQTGIPLEILLVDDGSTEPATVTTLNAAATGEHVRLIRQENRGVSAARNRGLTAMTGDFFAFVDADDTLEPGFLSEAVAAFGPHTDAVWGRVRWCDEAGKTRRENRSNRTPPVTLYNLENGGIRENFLRECLGWKDDAAFSRGLTPEIWGKVYRKSTLGTLRFCEDLSLAEDQLFTAAFLLRAREVRVLSRIGYHYFVREISLMRSRSLSAATQYRLFFEHFAALLANGPQTLLSEKAYFTLRELLEVFPFDRLSNSEAQAALTSVTVFLHAPAVQHALTHLPLTAGKVPLYDRLLARFDTCRALLQARRTVRRRGGR